MGVTNYQYRSSHPGLGVDDGVVVSMSISQSEKRAVPVGTALLSTWIVVGLLLLVCGVTCGGMRSVRPCRTAV